MTDIAEYERRIAFALERIDRGVGALAARPRVEFVESAEVEFPEAEAMIAAVDVIAETAVETGAQAEDPRIAELADALDTERQTNAMLSERVRAIREKQETTLSAMEKRLVQATQAMEAAQAETARLKRANLDLSEANRALVEAAGDPAPHLVNSALQAELDALRAARALEATELTEILSAIEPLVSAHATPEVGENA